MATDDKREPFIEVPPEGDPCNLGALGRIPILQVFTAMLILGGYRCVVVQDYNADGLWSRMTWLVGPTDARTLMKDEPATDLVTMPTPKLVLK